MKELKKSKFYSELNSYGANKSTIFGFSRLEKIFPNDRVRRFYTGNTYILCRAKLKNKVCIERK